VDGDCVDGRSVDGDCVDGHCVDGYCVDGHSVAPPRVTTHVSLTRGPGSSRAEPDPGTPCHAA